MNAPLRALAVLTVMVLPIALAGCAAMRTAQHPAAGGAAGAMSPAQLLAAVQGDADGIDRSKDPAERARLLAAATASARQCLAQAPDAARCQYAQAQVLGLTARAQPLQAPALLKQMLASLTQAEARDPLLDHAGPARLMAIVLLRAPPWPLGPGDVEAAVAAAQRAVKRDSAYPPNLITLAQAQAKADGAGPARATFAKARQAVQAWADVPAGAPTAAAADRARWQQAIEQGLHALQ